jgi:hypothetical protein
MSNHWNSGVNGDDETEELIELVEAAEAATSIAQRKSSGRLNRVATAITTGAAIAVSALGVGAHYEHSASAGPARPDGPRASEAAAPSAVPSVPVALGTPSGQSKTFDPCCAPPQSGSGSPSATQSSPSTPPTSSSPSPAASTTSSSSTTASSSALAINGAFMTNGSELVVTGSGFTPDAQAELLWDHQELDTVTADADGVIEDDIPVWRGLVAGTMHTLTAQQVDGGEPVVTQVYVPGMLESVLKDLLG